MTESSSTTPTQSEHHDLPTPISQDAAIPYWRPLVVVRWLQQQLSQILSQLHLLAITRGRSLRWQRLCRRIIQAGVALLLVAGVMPLPSAAVTLSSLVVPQPAHAANAPALQVGSVNPLDGMDVGKFSTPSFADLDGDGDLDAFIGESSGKIKYFQNSGSLTSPAFIERSDSLNPLNSVDLIWYSAPSFADLDGDGDLDAFIGEGGGTIKYFQNTGSATSPAFTQINGSFNPLDGVAVWNYSTPSFADLDADGDLDAYIGEFHATIHYYKNTGSATSPAFVQVTGSLDPFNGVNTGDFCTPSFADLDVDGDLDSFIGNYYGDILYFQNTGSASSPAFIQRTGSLSPFNYVDVGAYSAPSFADLDGDSDTDLFIGKDDGTIQYVENTRSASSPIFGQRSGSLNPLDLVHVGYYSTPSFADLDADGDLDSISGERWGTIKYFQNTGSTASPAFIERSASFNPFNSVDVGNYNAPAFADLDGDGDLDLFVGDMSSNIFYFQNTGNATSPAFAQTTGTFNPFNGLSAGTYSAPTFADLDGDGDLDAIIGVFDPYVRYFQNIGDATSPAFVQRTGSLNPFDGFMIGNQTKPAFADLDKDGDLDAFIAEVFGHIYYYQNTGSATSPAFVKRSGSLNPFNNVIAGQYFAPSFADLDADGDLDAFIGETYGSIIYYKNILLTRQVHLPLALR